MELDVDLLLLPELDVDHLSLAQLAVTGTINCLCCGGKAWQCCEITDFPVIITARLKETLFSLHASCVGKN